jgi:hypothetical protein
MGMHGFLNIGFGNGKKAGARRDSILAVVNDTFLMCGFCEHENKWEHVSFLSQSITAVQKTSLVIRCRVCVH